MGIGDQRCIDSGAINYSIFQLFGVTYDLMNLHHLSKLYDVI